jgi:hypothetical protein
MTQRLSFFRHVLKIHYFADASCLEEATDIGNDYF